MTELVLPKRRFARYFVVSCVDDASDFYGWILGNATLRRFFTLLKGERKIVVGDDPAEKFTAIYESHFWVDDESRSGSGSNLYATEKIRKAIPGLLSTYGVHSVL